MSAGAIATAHRSGALSIDDAAPADFDAPSHRPRLYVEGKDEWTKATQGAHARFSPEEIVLPALLTDSDGYELAEVRCVGGYSRPVALVAADGERPELSPPHVDPEDILIAHALTDRCPQDLCFAVIDRDFRYREREGDLQKLWNPLFEKRTKGMRLVCWTRHELESYFLDPALLCKFPTLKKGVTEQQLWDRLLATAKERVFLDAYNLTVDELRGELQIKSPAVRHARYEELGGLAVTQEQALAKLTGLPWCDEKTRFLRLLTDDALKSRFNAWLSLLTGEEHFTQSHALTRDKGQWRQRMSGKDLLCHLLTEQFFAVRDGQGRLVKGPALVAGVLADLAQQMADGLPETPPEFKSLRDFFITLRRPAPPIFS